jgi:phosphoribulokinase
MFTDEQQARIVSDLMIYAGLDNYAAQNVCDGLNHCAGVLRIIGQALIDKIETVTETTGLEGEAAHKVALALLTGEL